MDKICKSLTGMNVDNLFEFKTKSIYLGRKIRNTSKKRIVELNFFKNHTEKSYVIDTEGML